MDSVCKIPRYLDSPIQILVWDVDIFLPGALVFIIGVFTHNMVFFGLISFGYLYMMTKLQHNLPRGMMNNIMHKYGIYPYARYPDGFIRVFRG